MTRSGRRAVERATCVTLRRRSPMVSVTGGSGGRAARERRAAGQKLEQMWKTHASAPHRSIARPANYSLVSGFPARLHAAVMTCWEHK
jgi:hypothetical protein